LKHLLIAILVLILPACKTLKQQQSNDDIELKNLIEYILIEFFDANEEICLINQSISFDFKFPSTFKGGDTNLSIEERTLIEERFKGNPIKWKDIIQSEYISKDYNCLRISEPIIIRNGRIAFVYKSQAGSEFYDIYENAGKGWKLKENIITILN